MTYAKTQRGTHAHRTHSHTSYFTLEYIICIKHCSSFVKDENEYINYAQKGIIGYVYVTVSVCVCAPESCTPICISAFYFIYSLLWFNSSLFVSCVQEYKNTQTQTKTHTYKCVRDSTKECWKWKVKFPEKTRTYNNFGMCQTNKRMAEQKNNNSNLKKKKQKKKERERHIKDIYVLRYDSWVSFSTAKLGYLFVCIIFY